MPKGCLGKLPTKLDAVSKYVLKHILICYERKYTQIRDVRNNGRRDKATFLQPMQICARMEQKMAAVGNWGGKVYKRFLLCRLGL